ncbi:MAG: QacE family quaternary ammonium compound efflux SMR transporter [Proteobacteria bacterium]|nr:QacE family quaternary ammonium compound efflux SMR transporter [Pseudomonadota bacterium]
MAWLILLVAGAVEIVMAAALKAADGWSRPVPAVIGILAALASIFLLTHAMKSLPAGTAYAVWTGIGAVGVTLVGMVVHGDSASPLRLLCVGLVVAGVIGLRLVEEA